MRGNPVVGVASHFSFDNIVNTIILILKGFIMLKEKLKNDDGSLEVAIFVLLGIMVTISFGLIGYSSYSNARFEEELREEIREVNTVVLNEAMLLRAKDASDENFVELIINNSEDKIMVRYIDDEGKRSFQPGEIIIVETYGYVNGVEKYNSVSSE